MCVIKKHLDSIEQQQLLLNVNKDCSYLPEELDDGIDFPHDQRQLISSNPYFKPKKD